MHLRLMLGLRPLLRPPGCLDAPSSHPQLQQGCGPLYLAHTSRTSPVRRPASGQTHPGSSAGRIGDEARSGAQVLGHVGLTLYGNVCLSNLSVAEVAKAQELHVHCPTYLPMRCSAYLSLFECVCPLSTCPGPHCRGKRIPNTKS